MDRRILFIALLIGLMSFFSCLAAAFAPKGNEQGSSPGPSGAVIGERNYRIQLTWIREAGQYGPGEYGRQLRPGGRSRYYQVHVPRGYQPGRPTPVVLVLHGGGGNPDIVRYNTRMDETSDQHGFLAIYPAATSPVFTDRLLFWNAGARPKSPKQRKIDDTAFIAAVLDDAAQYFSIDPKRVYATGLSNGAHMCYLLASKLSDRIAAIGPVAGQREVGQYAPPPLRPMPLIHFHGKSDTWALFNGGHSNSDKSGFEEYEIAPAAAAVATWAKHNGCGQAPAETRVGSALCVQYTGCQQNADVVLWILEDAGHTWPGGRTTRTEDRAGVGKINTDISASEEMWKFFESHPKP